MLTIEDHDCDPFITRDCEWGPDFVTCTHKFNKAFTNDNRVEEEAIIDNGTYGLKFDNDKNIVYFNKTQKSLVCGNTELFTGFTKTIKDSRKDMWTNIVEREYKHDSNNIPGL